MSLVPFQPIAITGVSALFPQARTLDEFWQLILSGRDCMQEVPRTHWLIEDFYDPTPKAALKTYAKKGAFLREVPFDPVAYGLPPTSLPSTDIAQVLALMLARAVLEDASGGQVAKLKLDRTSVILGVASATELISSMSGLLTRPMWIEGMRRAGVPEPQVQEAVKQITALFPEWNENTFPGCLGNVVAGRVANRFNLGGTNCVTDAACASSLAALHMGLNELQLGTADRVISGGVDALNSIFMFMCFSQTPAMSASGKCSPFSQGADGTMMGEGGGMLSLRRLSDAERDGDKIYAVIRAIGSSSDGRAKSVYAPRPEGQAVALQRCYELAGYSPATVQLIEAHGTGTGAGDACETAALKEVFSAAAPEARQTCALGSIKSQIGHTKGAAGTAGLIKAALALRHAVLPPTTNIDTPNPALGLEASPFYLNTEARPWIQVPGQPRRAAVSAFGFGGTNFHVALEEYRGEQVAPRVRAFGAEVFLASGDASSASATVESWLQVTEAAFAATARLSQGKYSAQGAVRCALVASTPAELATKAAKLRDALSRGDTTVATKDGLYLSRTPAIDGNAIAYLFPGQGSQSVGMAAELLMQFEPAMDAWQKLEALQPVANARLGDLVYPRPVFSTAEREAQETLLRRTEHAQPALGAVSLSYLAVLEAGGLRPALTGGHSYGEIPALYAAGVIGWEDCVKISRCRGELMAAAAAQHEGAMTAVLHPAAEVAEWLTRFSGCVIANHNSPRQVVVAGPLASLTEFETFLGSRSITFKRLPVATAFHSPIVADACAPFAAALADVAFVPATIPVYGNRNAAPYPADPAAMRALLASQLGHAVRFADELQAMHANGARIFVEVGAGGVLTGLVRQTLGETATAIALNPNGASAAVGLLQGLAQLAVLGAPVAWDFLWDGYRPLPAPERLSAATLQVGGYNIGRPYPSRDGTRTPPVPAAPAPAALAAPVPAPVAMPRPALLAAPATVRSTPAGSVPAPRVAPVPSSRPPTPIVNSRPTTTSDAIVRAHETFLRTMAETHRSFLEAVSGQTPSRASTVSIPAAPVVSPAPLPLAPAPVRSEGSPGTPLPGVAAKHPVAAPSVSAPASAVPSVAAGTPVPTAPAPVSAATATPALSSAAVIEVVLKTVAEKTGYPREMLEPTMLLEGDLGIDSIKRVEILSAVQKQLPGLPAVDAKVMGGLQTLQAISDYLLEQLGGASVVSTTSAGASAPVAATPAATTPAFSSAAVIEVVLKTVAEKTGYPREMLEPTMLLEGDLGIDSIKRVEILSAVQKQLPGLPAVDAKVMGGLQTLQAISDYLIEQLGGAASAVPPASAGTSAPAAAIPAASTPAFSSAAVIDVVLKTVAEKTGYPREMLEPTMLLEGDLGIDSIKRVEILSAVQKQLPGLPAVDAKVMGGLQTLQAISDYLIEQLGGGATTAAKLVQIAVTAGASKKDALPVKRYGVRTTAIAAPGLALPGLHGSARVVITDDRRGIAPALREALSQHGITAEVVTEVPPDAPGVILLDGLRDCTSETEEDTLLRAVFDHARRAAGTLATKPGFFVTVQDTDGDFGLTSSASRPWAGALAGLAKTAAKEWSKATVRAIDLASRAGTAAETAQRLCHELLHGGSALEVGLTAEGGRVQPEVFEAPAASGTSALTRNSVLVATGGGRGVTAATLIALAQAHHPKMALLGRTALRAEPAALAASRSEAELRTAVLALEKAAGRTPTPKALGRAVADILAQREIQATLAALRAAGSEAEYFACDSTDATAVQATLTQVRSTLGPIRAIVHGAGVLADKLIADKTPEQFARVVDTKVRGLRALLHATATDDLAAVVLFSSVAGRFGNRGQADYAMANEFLNKAAHAIFAARQGRCLVRSINWGPWEGGMVTPELRQHFADQGIGVIPREDGALALVSELSGPASRAAIEVVVGAGRLDLGAAAPGETRVVGEVAISVERFPAIADHVVKGRPVVPIALAAEWLLGAASTAAGATATGLKDLQVLKALVLPETAEPLLVQLQAKASGSTFEVIIADPATRQAHYKATAVFGAATLPPAPAKRPSLQPFGYAPEAAYDQRLFHGPEFQVIRALRGWTAANAELDVENRLIEGGAWHVGPALLDGALQAAALWTLQTSGKSSLPMRIAELSLARPARTGERLTCQLTGSDKSGVGSVSDVLCLDAKGTAVCVLRGVECYHVDSYWNAVTA